MARSWSASASHDAVDPDGKAHGRDRHLGAKPPEQTVVASAGDQLAHHLGSRIVQLEHDASVVIDTAAETGGKPDACNIDAARGDKASAVFKQFNFAAKCNLGIGGKSAQCGGRLVGAAGNRKEAFDQCAHLLRQRGGGAKRGLFEEAFCNLNNTAPA